MTHDNPPATQGAFKPADAAAWLSISRSQLYRLLKSGEIRARRCGTRLLISRRALEEYLEGEASSRSPNGP
jgi:excisionase family DNA binding protein